MMLLIFHLCLLAVLSFFAGILIWNLCFIHRIDPRGSSEGCPFLSVLIPARNEERNIEACLRSLQAQTYPHYEIIVYDDGSTDRTRDILIRMAASDRRIRFLEGGELPAGWLGKCFACSELARAARGEWLLFTDAGANLANGKSS